MGDQEEVEEADVVRRQHELAEVQGPALGDFGLDLLCGLGVGVLIGGVCSQSSSKPHVYKR